jgi:hypothetical protein
MAALFCAGCTFLILPCVRVKGALRYPGLGESVMTSEVCLMNRLALVLAADSATTVTHWTESGSEDRYFKGANKIFQLSDHHPVGLMIFDSADLLRVPWEIVVKAFRHDLGGKSFNSLAEYAAEFFAFIERSPLLFPPDIQKSVFLDNARSAALRNVVRDFVPGQSGNDRKVASDALVEKRRQELAAATTVPTNLNAHEIEQTVALWKSDLVGLFENWRDAFGESYPTDLASFAELGMAEVFANPEREMGATGLVFAGFGDHDVFPAFAEYKSCGILCGKHVANEVKRVSITHDIPAWLDSFAQTDMSDTFSMGISRGVYMSVMETIRGSLGELAASIAQSLNVTEIPSFDKTSDAILADARQEHAVPMRRVLGVLPVDEMSELAETLINLQSLKEKVTKKSETVGGPVDVAIITKNEGFIWSKRKHFFDIEINPRYALRQQARLR